MALIENVIYDIDELVSFGTVKLSTATLKALELEERETGHHVGQVALIHSMRAATNEKLARDEAERRYTEEFGRPNPNALEYYRALPLPEPTDAYPHLTNIPNPEYVAPPETPEAEWLRNEREAKEPAA